MKLIFYFGDFLLSSSIRFPFLYGFKLTKCTYLVIFLFLCLELVHFIFVIMNWFPFFGCRWKMIVVCWFPFHSGAFLYYSSYLYLRRNGLASFLWRSCIIGDHSDNVICRIELSALCDIWYTPIFIILLSTTLGLVCFTSLNLLHMDMRI